MMLFIKGESIILKAVLTSNRKITKSNLVWVSNIDGKLGSRSLLEPTNLSVGNHIWDARSSATATDPNACKKPFASHALWSYINSLYLLVHENRHNMTDDPGHTICSGVGNMDQRLEDGSGHAWAAMYLMWVYKYGSYDPHFIKNEAKILAVDLLKTRFCSKPTHSNPKVQAIIDELIP